MESAGSVEQSFATGVGARELNGSLDTLAAGTAEKCAFQTASGAFQEALGQAAGRFGNMALQHGGPATVQFIVQSLYDLGMVVAGIVYAVTGKKIQNAPAAGSKKLDTGAMLIDFIHFQQVEQVYPLGVDGFGVGFLDLTVRDYCHKYGRRPMNRRGFTY